MILESDLLFIVSLNYIYKCLKLKFELSFARDAILCSYSMMIPFDTFDVFLVL